MSLTEIPLPAAGVLEAIAIPEAIERFVTEAERRIEEFQERTSHSPRLGFVPSDFRAVHRVLPWIRSQRLAAGISFCEWGSGFGVVAMLAAAEGFHATGIEVDRVLLAESIRLASDFHFDVDFVGESFVPDGSRVAPAEMDEMAWMDYEAPAAYEALGCDPDDFDVIFAYPWPGESRVIYELFDAHACTGALLLTFHGVEGLRLHRRDARRRGRR